MFYTQSTITVISRRETERLSNLVFYTQSTITVISRGERERVTWCFTPSQPLRLYQGGRERESNLVFYTQSTITVICCCMSTLHLVHYALLLTPACWKSNNTIARQMASAPSLALDPTFGIHSHKTLDTAQP